MSTNKETIVKVLYLVYRSIYLLIFFFAVPIDYLIECSTTIVGDQRTGIISYVTEFIKER